MRQPRLVQPIGCDAAPAASTGARALLRGYLVELRRLGALPLEQYLLEAYAGHYLVQVSAQTT